MLSSTRIPIEINQYSSVHPLSPGKFLLREKLYANGNQLMLFDANSKKILQTCKWKDDILQFHILPPYYIAATTCEYTVLYNIHTLRIEGIIPDSLKYVILLTHDNEKIIVGSHFKNDALVIYTLTSNLPHRKLFTFFNSHSATNKINCFLSNTQHQYTTLLTVGQNKFIAATKHGELCFFQLTPPTLLQTYFLPAQTFEEEAKLIGEKTILLNQDHIACFYQASKHNFYIEIYNISDLTHIKSIYRTNLMNIYWCPVSDFSHIFHLGGETIIIKLRERSKFYFAYHTKTREEYRGRYNISSYLYFINLDTSIITKMRPRESIRNFFTDGQELLYCTEYQVANYYSTPRKCLVQSYSVVEPFSFISPTSSPFTPQRLVSPITPLLQPYVDGKISKIIEGYVHGYSHHTSSLGRLLEIYFIADLIKIIEEYVDNSCYLTTTPPLEVARVESKLLDNNWQIASHDSRICINEEIKLLTRVFTR